MSVRLRLTLWNVCVLALMLTALGAGLRWTLQASLIASADRMLQGAVGRVQDFADFPPPGPPLGGPPRPPYPLRFGKNRPGHSSPFGSFPPQAWNLRGSPLNFGPPRPFPAAGSVNPPYDLELFRLSRLGEVNYATMSLGGQPMRLLSIPLRQNGTIIGVAQAALPLKESYAEVRHLGSVLLLLAGPGLLLAGFGGAYLTTLALRPVRQITQAASQIQAAGLSQRLPVAGHDELSELSATFNGMLGRLEQAFTQLSEANAQQRRFTADASHELKTPLTVIEGTVSLALSHPRTAEQYHKALVTVSRSTSLMTRIVQDLLLLARSDAGELLPERRLVSLANVVALAQDVVVDMHPEPPIQIDLSPNLTVAGDPDHLTRLFVNLLENAARHTSADGCIKVTGKQDGAFVTVDIHDTGAGIAPQHLPHLFDRFYRVDSARARRHGGTGLGLAICRSIAEAHGGSLTLDSMEGQGTTVSIRLPRTTTASTQ